ncbi:MAG: c-type cytochrome biogenesis protein CcmI [Burkholderiales bacterium]|jgi:cytochrome c-type biogenesis protein CcmH|nr:c-type cytochrome biogenesis protein CcmI [Burkholderiales bacterium]
MEFAGASAVLFVILGLMLAVALAIVVPALLRAKPRAAAADRAMLNAEVYRSQLADLERELAAGVLTADEHARMADDLRRRLLVEARSESTRQSGRAPRWAAAVVAVALPVLAIGLYALFGSPQSVGPEAASVPVADLAAAPDAAAMIEKLEAHLRRTPDDARSWILLARAKMATDRFDEAASAYAKGLEASRKVARDPQVWCEYADALGMAQGGTLQGKPRELVDRALSIDANHPKALEMAGSAEYEAGNFKAALGHWERLLAQLPPGSSSHRELATAIERTRRLAADG